MSALIFWECVKVSVVIFTLFVIDVYVYQFCQERETMAAFILGKCQDFHI